MKKEIAIKFCNEQVEVLRIFKTYNEFNLNNTPSFWDYKWL